MIIIAAVTEDGGLGYQGELLYHIPQDMERFRQLTMGKTIVMGRKTMESLPGKQPLSGRINVVLTKQNELEATGFEISHHSDQWYQKDCVVIGGAQIYEEFLPYAKRVYLTRIIGNKKADVYFPNIQKEKNLKLMHQSERFEYENIQYWFEIYEKVN